MKCEVTNAILTCLLGALILLGALFALQTVFHTRQLRMLQAEVLADQGNLNRLNLLLNDAAQYGKTHPDINPILQPFESKPASH